MTIYYWNSQKITEREQQFIEKLYQSLQIMNTYTKNPNKVENIQHLINNVWEMQKSLILNSNNILTKTEQNILDKIIAFCNKATIQLTINITNQVNNNKFIKKQD